MTSVELVTTEPLAMDVAADEPERERDDPVVVLRARGLVVRYGPHPALQSVDLDLRRGEVLGLLGPNGAGKSTLIRRLAGVLPSRAGTVDLDGSDPATSRVARSHIGYLPEESPLYPDETVLGYVTYMAALAGVPRAARRGAAAEALDRAGASKFSRRLTGRLSKGQRQRAGFAAAIVHRPDVVLLDEPTSGLDPAQMVKFREVLRDVARSSAVLFSTHLLAEAQTVCDRVVILDRGSIVAERTVDRRAAAHVRVRVEGADPAALEHVLSNVPGVIATAGDRCEVAGPDVAKRIAAAVHAQGWELAELAVVPDDLEQAFLDAVTRAPS